MDSFSTYGTVETPDERAGLFLRSVYGWMFAGLAVTALTAAAATSSPLVVELLYANQLFIWALVIAQLVLVFLISSGAGRLEPREAAGLFALYSALTGVTASAVLLVYTGASVFAAFLTAAGMFGATALLGTAARKSLSGAGQ